MFNFSFSDNLLLTVAITGGGLLFYQLLFFILRRWSLTRNRVFFSALRRHIYMPGFIVMLFLTFLIDLTYLQKYLHPKLFLSIRHLLVILTIIAVAALVIKVITVLREILVHQYKHHSHGEFSLRKANTKFQLIQQVLNVLIIIAAASVILMTFNGVKQLGTSLLASAGVVGLILGFAAQKSLGTLFAGIQIAISQPIRLDDVVVVEDKFGTIGEITLTYVTVNVWDGSRLIVPINYFLEKPFENWTRVSAEVIGKVKINTDYNLPIEEVRAEFNKWLEETPLWDRRSSGLIISGADEKTIEIRATMSAKNSSDGFDLESLIREKLITFIRTKYPDCLPKTRFIREAAESKGFNKA
jgi:small-conductance mechanosensitive channel